MRTIPRECLVLILVLCDEWRVTENELRVRVDERFARAGQTRAHYGRSTDAVRWSATGGAVWARVHLTPRVARTNKFSVTLFSTPPFLSKERELESELIQPVETKHRLSELKI